MTKRQAPSRLLALAMGIVVVALGSGCGDRTDPRIQEGYDLVVAGRVDEAVALANALLADDEKNVQARNLLGLALYKTGDNEGSIVHYDQAIEASPEYPEAHFNRANSLQMLGRRDEAEQGYLKAVQLKKDFVLAHYNLGVIYADTGRWDQAISAHRRALDHDPEFYFAYIALGQILYAQGNFDDAAANLSKSLELQPEAKEIRVLLGNAYLQTGREDAANLAENEFRAAAGMDPQYLDAVYSVGVALAAQNRTEEAAEWFGKARELTGDDPQSPIAKQLDRFFKEHGDPAAASGAAG